MKIKCEILKQLGTIKPKNQGGKKGLLATDDPAYTYLLPYLQLLTSPIFRILLDATCSYSIYFYVN